MCCHRLHEVLPLQVNKIITAGKITSLQGIFGYKEKLNLEQTYYIILPINVAYLSLLSSSCQQPVSYQIDCTI